MATKQAANPAPVAPIVDLVALRAQRKALSEQIKAAQAAQPKQTPLERVIDRQARQCGKWVGAHLAVRAAARIRAGQDRATALAEVVAFYIAQAETELTARLSAPPTTDDADDDQ